MFSTCVRKFPFCFRFAILQLDKRSTYCRSGHDILESLKELGNVGVDAVCGCQLWHSIELAEYELTV